MRRCPRGLALAAALCSAPVHGGAELLVFPQLTGSRAVDTEAWAWTPAVDFFASGRFGAFRYLAEVLVADDEAELERLQLGWAPRPTLTLWLGRFHNPLDYWHDQYHHGEYTQPTIGHPGIVAFEDDGGVLPQHLAGLLVRGERHTQAGLLQLDAALALAPQLRDSALEPPDLARPSAGRHRLGATVRLAWRDAATVLGETGAFAGAYRIAFAERAGDAIRQRVAGFYFNREGLRHRLTGAAFWVRNEVPRAGARPVGAFQSAYLHGEHALAERWTLYAQLAGSRSARNDPYLALLPDFVSRRTVVGLRWDFTRRQAFKLELSRARRGARRFDELALQWSAAFP